MHVAFLRCNTVICTFTIYYVHDGKLFLFCFKLSNSSKQHWGEVHLQLAHLEKDLLWSFKRRSNVSLFTVESCLIIIIEFFKFVLLDDTLRDWSIINVFHISFSNTLFFYSPLLQRKWEREYTFSFPIPLIYYRPRFQFHWPSAIIFFLFLTKSLKYRCLSCSSAFKFGDWVARI